MQDKKKLMVLGVLVAVILCVGAFSFLGGSSPAPSTDVAKKEEGKKDPKVADKGEEEADAPKNPLYAADLPQRDPFQIRPLPGEVKKPETPVTPPPQQSLPKATRRGGNVRRSIDTGGDFAPVTMSGPLPSAGGGGLAVTPSGPDPSAFSYSLSGVLVGQRPVAVFKDSQGNDRMVPLGGSLDGDSKVVAIDKGQVTVEHRGKKLRLPLGGNPQ